MEFTRIERLQRLHFEKIGASYRAQYGDYYSQAYRSRFINAPLCEGVDVSSKRVLEAMCGNGQTTEFLLAKGAQVTGLDFAPEQIESFKTRWPDCDAHCASIFDTRLESSSFDAVVVVGGLHHLQPRVVDAVYEIHRILTSGGVFCFAEPYKGSLPDSIRTQWYKRDSMFAANEAAIDLATLKEQCASRFLFQQETYLGGLAYLLVLNSMVCRIPPGWKRHYAPWVLKLEALTTPLSARWNSCFVVCQWQKR